MKESILLNDLLNLSTENIERAKVRFNQYNGQEDPMEVYLRNPDEVNDIWLFWRAKNRYFNVGEIAICLFQLSADNWLLSTIKKVTCEFGVINAVNYNGEMLEEYSPYFGRVIIKYNKTHQTQVVHLKNVINELEIAQILPNIFDGIDFPGYDKVRLSYGQLSTIVHRQKQDWVAALKNQKAVYLIVDRESGSQYVGSAYGENGMLLQRWISYINDGHGGNKLLRLIVDKLGIDYVKKNFQYSILENYNARTDKNIILARESWWKETLGSRAFGLNAN
ncbi:GIY-YIG nuclease family protein [Sedimentibacter sp.]|uniref:GIY-YIG nuclease family protein n=1 Tax=Sedimentibacter sp. TaxID=1960295 RepID=UPI00289A9D03|nr:GIY-YIG nuclease family protein [Sedimentibacter sp.]